MHGTWHPFYLEWMKEHEVQSCHYDTCNSNQIKITLTNMHVDLNNSKGPKIGGKESNLMYIQGIDPTHPNMFRHKVII